MKTKKASKNNQKSRIIFFVILFTYNLLLGLYLKDFLVISPMLVTLYLLSALPTLFFCPENTVNTYAHNRVHCSDFRRDNEHLWFCLLQ
jgi:hypothetical protein